MTTQRMTFPGAEAMQAAGYWRDPNAVEDRQAARWVKGEIDVIVPDYGAPLVRLGGNGRNIPTPEAVAEVLALLTPKPPEIAMSDKYECDPERMKAAGWHGCGNGDWVRGHGDKHIAINHRNLHIACHIDRMEAVAAELRDLLTPRAKIEVGSRVRPIQDAEGTSEDAQVLAIRHGHAWLAYDDGDYGTVPLADLALIPQE